MAAGGSSFIDIAVIDAIRTRFSRGEALVVLDTALERIIWANGSGAALFGFRDIETIMGASAGLGLPARRQIAATPGFPAVGGGRSVSIRLASGLSSRMTMLEIAAVTMPDGLEAILLAQAAPLGGILDETETARRAIAGIGSGGRHAAILGGDGSIVASTPGFTGLGFDAGALAGLAREVGSGPLRVVKRMLAGAAGPVPAAFARLADEPARFLLLAVDETAEAPDEQAPEEAPPSSPAAPESPPVTAAEPSAPAFVFEIHGETPPAPAAQASSHDQVAVETGDEPATDDADAAPVIAPGTPSPAGTSPVSRILPAFPVRFVWRTDAEGRVSALSPEFLAAVGQDETALLGHDFGAIARRLGFDEEGEIAALLARRDTWSGRTVMWPVEGSGLRAPVDLAALPVYGRDRQFEGFRGFGVARLGDAVEEVPRGDATASQDPFKGEQPVIEVSPTPDRRAADKVVRLAERRIGETERKLSSADQVTFKEIGDRLKTASSEQRRAAATPAADEPVPQAVAPVQEAAPAPEAPVASANAAAPTEPAPTPREVAPVDAASAAMPSAFALPQSRAETRAEPAADTSIIAQLPIPVLIVSGEELQFANRAFFDLTGYGSIGALGAAGGLGELFADAIAEAGEDAAGQHVLLRRADGATRPVEAHMRAVPWRGGRALMLVMRDVSEAEAPVASDGRHLPPRTELEARVAEMRTILDTATDGVVLITPDRTIRSMNRPAEALFGFDSDDVAGKPFVSLFAMESQKAARDYLGGLADNGVASVLNDGREVIGREAQGRFIPLFMTIGKLPADSGYCAVMRDITPWKRAEEELTQARAEAERASSQKTEFLARISHEIRTPLNAIIGFSELMMDEKFGPIGNDRYRDYLRDINRSGNLVLDLVNDLLDISKIEAGEQEMSYEAVSLNDTLGETVAMMQPQANRERVIIRSSFASKLPEIVADLRSIRQIALNLLSNAVRYTQAGGQVIVSTSYETSGDVVMRVRDTGIGMSAAEIEQALKPFKQINALKRGRSDGTGLGLPLTKAMVEANRARFQIHSVPGEGTLVEVVFPSTRVLAE